MSGDRQWYRTSRDLLVGAGWTYTEQSGGHEIWHSPTGQRFALPQGTRGSGREARNILASVRRVVNGRRVTSAPVPTDVPDITIDLKGSTLPAWEIERIVKRLARAQRRAASGKGSERAVIAKLSARLNGAP